MTSQKISTTPDVAVNHRGEFDLLLSQVRWLKEIALQLAMRHEQEGALDQQLKSAGKVLDGMAERMPPRSSPDLPLDQAMRLVDKIRNQLGELQALLISARELTSEHSIIRRLEDVAQDPQWAPDGPMKTD